MKEAVKQSAAARLTRIEGQVRGIARMIAEDRYCIDVINQVAAVKAALNKVEEEMLRDHVEHCLAHALAAGDAAERQRKIVELIQVLGHLAT
jgi:CsoR family transcriptional regulator, copper-sensing transcriptional repressor